MAIEIQLTQHEEIVLLKAITHRMRCDWLANMPQREKDTLYAIGERTRHAPTLVNRLG